MRNEFVRHPANARVFWLASGSRTVLVCLAFALTLVVSSGCAKKPTEAESSAQTAAAPADAAGETADAANAVGAPMPCPELTATRYPFLTCVRGEGGGPVIASAAPGEQGARLKIPSKFVSGDGHWGPSGLE